jgi:hypothetical protein
MVSVVGICLSVYFRFSHDTDVSNQRVFVGIRLIFG